MIEEMVYAPVIVTACYRYRAFVNCIESLEKNPWAKYTDIYVAIDYPRNEADISEFRKIVEYAENNIKAFAKKEVIVRERNYGYVDNFQGVINYVFQKYESIIYTEDDNIFSPCFLEYMDKCLAMFKENKRISAISGFSRLQWPGANNIYIDTGISFWGMGIWKDKWEMLDSMLTVPSFQKLADNSYNLKNIYRHSRRRFEKFINMYVIREYIIKHDSAYGCVADALDMYRICPVKSLVQNVGMFEEKAEHVWNDTGRKVCGGVEISEKEHFEIEIKEDILDVKYAKKYIDAAFSSKKIAIRTMAYAALIAVIGCKRTIKLWKWGEKVSRFLGKFERRNKI